MRKHNRVAIGVKDLVYPLFVKDGTGMREEIPSMPDIYRFSPDAIVREARTLVRIGIKAVLLFGVPAKKSRDGAGAYEKDNVVARAVKRLKRNFPDLLVMTDVCLCAYTSHGHCGIIKGQRAKGKGQENFIDNKATLRALSRMALSHAEAGADYVAPSAMAKGQVLAIREALDAHDFKNTKIMGYSAKYASNFYDPFRDAANSSPAFGDRSAYQLGFSDSAPAMKEIAADIKEGADIVMVKPALAYLDIIKEAAGRFRLPLAAYNVSGEYVMLKAYAGASGIPRLRSGREGQGAREDRDLVLEIMTSIKRAGADLIITYHAKEIAGWLKER
ncbi:MAG: porphobilinogen synthase [Candidatus Omnitrophota bacterium]|nr:porphobilinogen synthase [Candidatus Omnitrophota bacterium]